MQTDMPWGNTQKSDISYARSGFQHFSHHTVEAEIERLKLCICFATMDNCVLVAVKDSIHLQGREDTLFIMNCEGERFKG